MTAVNLKHPQQSLFHWRLMEKEDLKAVYNLANICHPDLPESIEVLAEKQTLAAKTCFVLEKDTAIGTSKELAGYILAHPWLEDAIPKLDEYLTQIPSTSSVLYLHDIAIAKIARGQGLAQKGLDKLYQVGQDLGFKRLTLTSVHNTKAFWQTQGFQILQENTKPQADDSIGQSLASYEEGACFMQKDL